jgi:hypothetical protein
MRSTPAPSRLYPDRQDGGRRRGRRPRRPLWLRTSSSAIATSGRMIPDDMAPDEVTFEKALELIEAGGPGRQGPGQRSGTGKPVYLKTGPLRPVRSARRSRIDREGHVKRGGKPKMASLFPNMSMETLTLDDALELLLIPARSRQASRLRRRHYRTGWPLWPIH